MVLPLLGIVATLCSIAGFILLAVTMLFGYFYFNLYEIYWYVIFGFVGFLLILYIIFLICLTVQKKKDKKSSKIHLTNYIFIIVFSIGTIIIAGMMLRFTRSDDMDYVTQIKCIYVSESNSTNLDNETISDNETSSSSCLAFGYASWDNKQCNNSQCVALKSKTTPFMLNQTDPLCLQVDIKCQSFVRASFYDQKCKENSKKCIPQKVK